MLLFIAAGTFITVALLILALTIRSERAIMQERMLPHQAAAREVSGIVESEIGRSFSERVTRPILGKLSELGTRHTPSGGIQAVQEKLASAGHPWGLTAPEFLGLKLLSIAGFVLAGLAALATLSTSVMLRLVAMILLVFIGAILPDYLLERKTTSRQREIRRALPNALDLLTVVINAGMGLDAAMQKVADKLKGPLSDEMKQALQEMQIGKLRIEALKDMERRVKVPELTSLVAAIYQADQLGASISKVLNVQSATMRTLRIQKAQETAARLAVKMLFPLVFFIFPALFVAVLAPGLILTMRALNLM